MQSRPAGIINVIIRAVLPGQVVVPQHLVGGYAVLLHEVLHQLPQRGLARLLELAAGLLVADLNMDSAVVLVCGGIGYLVIRDYSDNLAVQSDYVLRACPVLGLVREHSRRDIRIEKRQPVRACSCLPGVVNAYPHGLARLSGAVVLIHRDKLVNNCHVVPPSRAATLATSAS